MNYYDAVLKTYFGYVSMLIKVFGKNLVFGIWYHGDGNKIDTSLFVR